MNVSLITLARYLVENPDERNQLRRKVDGSPSLALSLEAVLAQNKLSDWVVWLTDADKQMPSLVPSLIEDFQAMGEETSMEVSPLRDATAAGPPPSPPPKSPELAWLSSTPAPTTQRPTPAPPASNNVSNMGDEDDDDEGEATMMEESLPTVSFKSPQTPSALFVTNPMQEQAKEDPFSATNMELELPLPPPPSLFPEAPVTPPAESSSELPTASTSLDELALPPQPLITSKEEPPPAPPREKRSSEEQKEIARRNSQLVYAGGLGWQRYQFNPYNGLILSETVEEPHSQWMHIRIEEDADGPMIREMHLHISEAKILVYRNLLWFWQNPSNKEMTKTDIASIAEELPDDTVDLLLDLVSPGLFVQAADAQLSYSFSQAIAPGGNPRKPHLENQLSPHQSQEMSAPSLTSGENAILSQSPFAVRPVSEEAGETTLTRRAILEPMHSPPPPSQLTIQQELQPTWWSRFIGRFLPQPPVLETISVLQVNETQEIVELGLSITFLIESTSSTTFPWVRVMRESHNNQDAVVTLQWNEDQSHKLPPNFKSTGALSRSPELGKLTITFEQPGYQPLRLHIHWS